MGVLWVYMKLSMKVGGDMKFILKRKHAEQVKQVESYPMCINAYNLLQYIVSFKYSDCSCNNANFVLI